MRYRCLTNCWHKSYRMCFKPGDIIPLEHLTKQEIDLLISRGIVSVIPDPPKVVKVTPKPQVGTPRKKRVVVRAKKKPVVEAIPVEQPVLTGRQTTQIEPVIEIPVIDEEKIDNG